jgi:hypothetical protein
MIAAQVTTAAILDDSHFVLQRQTSGFSCEHLQFGFRDIFVKEKRFA